MSATPVAAPGQNRPDMVLLVVVGTLLAAGLLIMLRRGVARPMLLFVQIVVKLRTKSS